MTKTYWALSILGGGAAVLWAYFQMRIRIQERREAKEIDGQSAKDDMLKHELAARAQEARESHQVFRTYVQAQTQAMNELSSSIKAGNELLQQHMTDSSARARNTYEKLSSLHERMAGMEKSIDTIARLKS